MDWPAACCQSRGQSGQRAALPWISLQESEGPRSVARRSPQGRATEQACLRIMSVCWRCFERPRYRSERWIRMSLQVELRSGIGTTRTLSPLPAVVCSGSLSRPRVPSPRRQRCANSRHSPITRVSSYCCCCLAPIDAPPAPLQLAWTIAAFSARRQLLVVRFAHSGSRFGCATFANSASEAHRGTPDARKPSTKSFSSSGRAKLQSWFSISSAEIDG